MTRSAPSHAHVALAALRERFRASAASTVAAFERMAARLAEAPDAPEVVEALRRELHRVHGTAGSYGFMEASRLAAKLEERAMRWARDPLLEREERGTVIEHFVGALRLALAGGDEGAAESHVRRRVTLVGVPARLVSALQAEAARHRWQVDVVGADDHMPQRLREQGPHVVVTVATLLAAVATEVGSAGVPILALDDRTQRSDAPVPHGATLLDAAVDAPTVVEHVERLAVRSTNAGATVLVLDDDPSVLAIVRYLVEVDGTRVVTLDDPARLDATLDEVRPSLLLMDVQMHQHDGIALVRALRRRADARSLPIVLFSTETQADVRQAAYDAGADEFIPKPIVPAELRGRIRGRLERQRLRRLADGLHPGTGLPLPARTEREAAAWLAAPTPTRVAAAVALVRPAGGDDGDGAHAAAWLREARRIAAAMPGGVAGLVDGIALLVVMPQDARGLAERLSILAAGSGALRWRAGVAGTGEVAGRELAVLRGAAAEACDLAGDAPAERVRTWSRAAAEVAPDVIIVEDDPALADMLQFALRSGGYSHRTFRSGPEALDGMLRMKTLGRRPLVLLDVDLPGMDGHSLHERLRTERPGAFGVVFVTVHGAEGEQIRALRSGALDWVVKPLSVRVLMAKIPIWLGHAARG